MLITKFHRPGLDLYLQCHCRGYWGYTQMNLLCYRPVYMDYLDHTQMNLLCYRPVYIDLMT